MRANVAPTQVNDSGMGERNVKKAIIVALVMGLVAGALAAPATAAKKKKAPKKVTREAESVYDTPAIGHPDAVVGCSGSTGCATFALGATESFISLEIVDSAGLPVYGRASQDTNGDGLGDKSFNFCGKTAEPVAVEPGVTLNIFISAAGGARPPCPGAATSGVVKAVISNLP